MGYLMIDLTFSVAANDSACFVYFGTGGVCGVAQLLWDTSIEATVKLILNEESYSQKISCVDLMLESFEIAIAAKKGRYFDS